jgi:hypothetical protein
MKKFFLILGLLLFTANLFAQKIGQAITLTTYSSNRELTGLAYSGYYMEVIHVEYLSNDSAKIFLAYAFWGADSGVKLLVYESTPDSSKVGSWFLKERTGVIHFLRKQKNGEDFLLKMEISSESIFWEKFTLKSTQKGTRE